MKAYWITRCHVHNPDEYDEYIKLAGPAINKSWRDLPGQRRGTN